MPTPDEIRQLAAEAGEKLSTAIGSFGAAKSALEGDAALYQAQLQAAAALADTLEGILASIREITAGSTARASAEAASDAAAEATGKLNNAFRGSTKPGVSEVIGMSEAVVHGASELAEGIGATVSSISESAEERLQEAINALKNMDDNAHVGMLLEAPVSLSGHEADTLAALATSVSEKAEAIAATF